MPTANLVYQVSLVVLLLGVGLVLLSAIALIWSNSIRERETASRLASLDAVTAQAHAEVVKAEAEVAVANKQVLEANTAAANVEKELADARQGGSKPVIAGRQITVENCGLFINFVKTVSKGRVTVEAIFSNAEAIQFAKQISDMLKSAGWDPFGPERRITRSKGNVLYELDGKSALQLYKRYLGEQDAKGLPATGVLFPLNVRSNLDDTALVRTVWSVNEAEQSMTFTGDLPEKGFARLMKANFDRLIDGAMDAARTSRDAVGNRAPDLALLISCVGRKMVLKQRTEEEVEGVREVMGDHTVLAGFYSNGEISPFRPQARCEHHNQTMTITTFREE